VENSSAPLKPLLLIAALVLIAHLALLGWVQGATLSELSPPNLTRPFITRTLPPSTPESAQTPLKPAARRPSQAARSWATPTNATPLKPAPSEASAPATQAQTTTDTVADSTIVAASTDTLTDTPQAPADSPSAPVTAKKPDKPPTKLVPHLAAISLPGSLRVKYDIKGEVSGLGYSASGELLWQHDGQTYDARLSVSHFLLGTRSQSSTGQITPEGLAPKRFGDKVRSEVAAHFERDKGQVIFSANTPSVDLQPGAQDQLSIFIQIGSLIAGNPAHYPIGSAFEMQAVGARDADTWRFVVESEERLSLPGGEQTTLRIKRPARQVHDITVELWLAPALGYLPARIRLTQSNGNFVDQQLASFAPP
jgi:hypothetical protein